MRPNNRLVVSSKPLPIATWSLRQLVEAVWIAHLALTSPQKGSNVLLGPHLRSQRDRQRFCRNFYCAPSHAQSHATYEHNGPQVAIAQADPRYPRRHCWFFNGPPFACRTSLPFSVSSMAGSPIAFVAPKQSGLITESLSGSFRLEDNIPCPPCEKVPRRIHPQKLRGPALAGPARLDGDLRERSGAQQLFDCIFLPGALKPL